MLSPMNLKALDLLDHLLIINRYCLLNDLMKCTLYLRKGSHHLMFDNNFGKGKWGPIFEIISPTDLWENSLCTHTKISISPAICCYTTLWKSKIQKCYWFWQHPQQTVDMFLRTLWGLDLTFDSSWTDCLKTADIDWLTNIVKFVRRRLESTVERCCIIFFPPWLFLHRLRSFYTLHFMCCTHIHVKSIVQYFCGRLHKISQ